MRIITVKAVDDPTSSVRTAMIHYWSNSAGDLYDPKNATDSRILNPENLPKPLRYVYERLWEEDAAGANCCLVETPEVGYGIALIYEYRNTKDSRLSQAATFEALLKDAEKLAAHDALWSATIYALEDMEDMGPVLEAEGICNELAVVFPAGIPEADFTAAKTACEEIAYGELREAVAKKETVVLVSENADGNIYAINCNWHELLNDWYGECNLVPANDAEVFFVSVGNEIIVDSHNQMSFEDVLELIRQTLQK